MSKFKQYLTDDPDDPHRAWRAVSEGKCPICEMKRDLSDPICYCRYCVKCGCHWLSNERMAGTWDAPRYELCELDRPRWS